VTGVDEATDRYAARLDQLATRSATRIATLFDQVAPWSPVDSDRFHAAATPYLAGAAQAAVDTTAAYATVLYPTVQLGVVSTLIVADAAARAYTPFDRIAHLLKTGAPMSQATVEGRAVAAALGHDTIYRPARQAIGQLIPEPGWRRRVHATSCDWCLELSSVEFDSAEAATFGHDNDKCIAVPSGVLGNHNQRIIDQRGFNRPEAVAERASHDQRVALQQQVRTAQKHQRLAHDQLATETDPVRRERLSIREQEWETRAEAAAERLRILTIGSHRLAA
jgi:hypothetical protein